MCLGSPRRKKKREGIALACCLMLGPILASGPLREHISAYAMMALFLFPIKEVDMGLPKKEGSVPKPSCQAECCVIYSEQAYELRNVVV